MSKTLPGCLPEIEEWAEGVPYFQDGAVLTGGPDCPDNIPLQALVNRTTYLRKLLKLKADLDSAALTGKPTAPTPDKSDVSDRIATMKVLHALVDGAVSVDLTPYALAENVIAELLKKADLDSPAMTGKPTAPTPDKSDVSDRIATMKALHALIEAIPAVDLSAYAKTQTVNDALSKKADLDSPAMTGKPTVPTAQKGDKSAQIANTSFVTTEIAAALPAGSVSYFAMPTAPLGYLKANGAAISRTAYADLFAALVTNAGFAAQAFAVTIATPAVFNKTAHGFAGGERLRLSTTGVLPTGLAVGTDYFVEVIDANTFYLNTSPYVGGTRVATSGAQSGVHSYLQSWYGLGDGASTFNLPDLRGEFIRAWDEVRLIDPRVFGSAQKGTLVECDTSTSATLNGVWSAGVTGNPTVASARVAFGADSFNLTDYPNTGLSGVNSATSVSSPGVAGEGGVVGVARPRNVALLACIKY